MPKFLSQTLIISILLALGCIKSIASENKKNQIEDIFIWKMSDELKLSASEEKKFSEIHKTLNQQKINLQTELVQLSYELRKNPQLSKKDISNLIKKYKKKSTEYSELNLVEINKMQNLLGDKRFLDYIAIKQDINSKLKNMLVGDDSGRSKNASGTVKALPPPQIIEEK